MVNGKVVELHEIHATTCAHCRKPFKEDGAGRVAYRGHDSRLYCSSHCATTAYATLLAAHEYSSREIH